MRFGKEVNCEQANFITTERRSLNKKTPDRSSGRDELVMLKSS